MALVNKISALKRPSHLETRLELRDERTYFRYFLRLLCPIYISFSAVDAVTTGGSFFFFLSFRTAMFLVATMLYVLLRARVHYAVRLYLLTAPWVYSVEYIMIRYDLTQSPYFAGFALVLFVSTIFFPTKMRHALPQYLACVAPVCVWYAFNPLPDLIANMNVFLMTLGSAIVCASNAAQMNGDLRRRFAVQETLARDLGKRQIEVWHKANELVKRKAFESQFSPQVVAAVLGQGSNVLEMSQQNIVALVIDVENSTTKAKTLEPLAYKAVIEEVFDVFSSACLRWNITVDKFTGDGAQAFAGAPVRAENDLYRALMAARDTLQMLQVRSFNLGRRWKSPLRVRIAACEGTALVGFLGRGSLKSFTAIGDTVSFAHRLCAAGEPGKVVVYSLTQDRAPDSPEFVWESSNREISNLKGFGDRKFVVSYLSPRTQSSLLVDNGRCPKCETPLILEESASGIPTLLCPGCIAREKVAA